MSLKVLVQYMKNKHVNGSGKFELSIDGEVISTLTLNEESKLKSLEFEEELDDWLIKN